MAEGKNIEFLAVAFTLGVAAGCLLPPGYWTGVLLPLVSLPLFLQKKLVLQPFGDIPWLFGGLFLLTGLFCALNDGLTTELSPGALEMTARDAATRLRAYIDSLPFPSAHTAPLLKAFLTGDRSDLSRETVAVFRGSGASHLLALSGLHIGMIYLMVDKLSWGLGRSRAVQYMRFVLMVGGAGFFTLMTGAGPSITRAFLFIAIGETLRLTGRPRKNVRVLCLALLVQLVLQPQAITGIGFQLSYLAMAGIFLLYPTLEGWYPAGKGFQPLRRIYQTAALSISCQVFTAPLVWLRFHSLPGHFLITNLLAIPLTTAIMACAIGTIILSAAGICPAALYNLTSLLCQGLLSALEIISSPAL